LAVPFNSSADTIKPEKHMPETDAKPILSRLSRIEGQVRGISRMVEEDRYCIDVMTQLQAVRAALGKVEEEILARHAASCVEEAIASGDVADQRRKFDELVRLFGRYR